MLTSSQPTKTTLHPYSAHKTPSQTEGRWAVSTTPTNGRVKLSTRCFRKLVTAPILYILDTSACCSAPPANPIESLRLGLDKRKDGVGWRRRDWVYVRSQFSASRHSAIPGEAGWNHENSARSRGRACRLGDNESRDGCELEKVQRYHRECDKRLGRCGSCSVLKLSSMTWTGWVINT